MFLDEELIENMGVDQNVSQRITDYLPKWAEGKCE